MNMLAKTFIHEFAKDRDLDPSRFISLELHAKKGIKYSYLGQHEIITVEELHTWDS
jgi:hypothetical protein